MEDPASVWADPEALTAQQERVGLLHPARWVPPQDLVIGACFVAFAPGEQGPGRRGDRAWVGAVTARVRPDRSRRSGAGSHHIGTAAPRTARSQDPGPLTRGLTVEVQDRHVNVGTADGAYVPGLLAMREGRMMAEALSTLFERSGRPDVLMLDATGRDHPRRCGVAVHLGWLLDIPSVGVTHRMLTRRFDEPPQLAVRGGSEAVGDIAAWVCTRDGVRPLVAHAGWRTDATVAAQLVVRTATVARTPEPLRAAREVARTTRASAHRR